MADSWRITSQRQTSTVSGGMFINGMEVSFVTTSGVPGSVFIALPSYNAETVKAAIDERVHQIEAVNSL